MRVNKVKITNYKADYNVSLLWFERVLLFIALISVVQSSLIGLALGVKALLIFVVAYFTARETEILFAVIVGNKERSKAIVDVNESRVQITGLVFALLLPIGTPIIALIVSLIFAIIIGKIAFGGFSYNIFNVAVFARVFAEISYPYTLKPFLQPTIDIVDRLIVNVFPIAEVYEIAYTDFLSSLTVNHLLFDSNTLYMLGSISPIVLLGCALFLMYKGILDYVLPLFTVLITLVMALIIGFVTGDIMFTVISASVVFVSFFVMFFVITDPITAPKSVNGKFVYASIFVFITFWMAYMTNNLYTFAYALLFANIFVAMLDSKSGKFSKVKKAVLLVIMVLILTLGALFINANQIDRSEQMIEIYESELGGM